MKGVLALMVVIMAGCVCGNPVKKTNTTTGADRWNPLWDLSSRGNYEMDDDEGEPASEDSYMDGDMILNQQQRADNYDDADEEVDTAMEDNGLKNEWYRWPAKTVVYHIPPGTYSESEINIIENAMRNISELSCVHFRRKTPEDKHYVLVRNVKGCSAHVGYQHNVQHLNLDSNGCVIHRIVLHELLHVLGFQHIQNSPERDDYVRINWNNIDKDNWGIFTKMNPEESENYGVYYDYWSIMHYHGSYFSKKWGDQALESLKTNMPMGEATKLSSGDIYKLKRMYNCF